MSEHLNLKNIQTKAHLNAFVLVYAQSALLQVDRVNEKLATSATGNFEGRTIGSKVDPTMRRILL
jgi:aspartyl-tRNA(Asn)/glutamyl-tRNA(Gln) amidotransferase subunit A